MGFLSDVVDSVSSAVSGAVSGVVQGVGEAVAGVASSVGNFAGDVGAFIQESPLGQFASAVPGLDMMMAVTGLATDATQTLFGGLAETVGFASRLGGQIIGAGLDVSGTLSPMNLGFLSAAVQSFSSVSQLVGLSDGLAPAFAENPQRPEAQQQNAQLGRWNVAQLLAAMQAALLLEELQRASQAGPTGGSLWLDRSRPVGQ
jgi:hypothetical protein